MDTKEAAWYTYGKKYEELTLASDFLFCKIMQDPELCKEMLQRIMGMKLGKVEVINNQKPIDTTFDGKSIRLDIYAEDENGNIYDIEMQCADTKELPQRSRFYQSMIDQDLLDKGQSYMELRHTVVIFVCKFDLFGCGKGKYSFHPYEDEEKDLQLQDGATRIFLNTKGKVLDPLLQHFLDYLERRTIEDDSFIHELESAVKRASHNSKWRDEYMRVSMREKYLEGVFKKIGLEEGRAEGRAQGQKEGRIELVCNALQRGMTEEQIISFLDVEPELIQEAKERLF